MDRGSFKEPLSVYAVINFIVSNIFQTYITIVAVTNSPTLIGVIKMVKAIVLFLAMFYIGCDLSAAPITYSYTSTISSVIKTTKVDDVLTADPYLDPVNISAITNPLSMGSSYSGVFTYDIDTNILSNYTLDFGEDLFTFDILEGIQRVNVYLGEKASHFTLTAKENLVDGIFSSVFHNTIFNEGDILGTDNLASNDDNILRANILKFSYDNVSYQMFGSSNYTYPPLLLKVNNVPSPDTLYLVFTAILSLLIFRCRGV